jgi:hypothetical protein
LLWAQVVLPEVVRVPQAVAQLIPLAEVVMVVVIQDPIVQALGRLARPDT